MMKNSRLCMVHRLHILLLDLFRHLVGHGTHCLYEPTVYRKSYIDRCLLSSEYTDTALASITHAERRVVFRKRHLIKIASLFSPQYRIHQWTRQGKLPYHLLVLPSRYNQLQGHTIGRSRCLVQTMAAHPVFLPFIGLFAPSLYTIVLCTNNRRSSECKTEFSGRYSKGNLARHYKAKHAGKGEGRCPAPGCSRTYRRGDSLLKHLRNAHLDLGMESLYTQRMNSFQGIKGGDLNGTGEWGRWVAMWQRLLGMEKKV